MEEQREGHRNFSVIKASLRDFRDRIRELYRPEKIHYIGVDAYEDEEGIEVRYWFFDYEKKEAVMVRVPLGEGIRVPTISDIVKPAFMGEWEIADLFGIEIEGRVKNFFLSPDSPRAPLLKEKGNGQGDQSGGRRGKNEED